MKNKNLWGIFSLLMLLLQLAAEVVTAVIVLRMNMLPEKIR